MFDIVSLESRESMPIFYMMILTVLAFLAFMPVLKLYQYKDYAPFKALRAFVGVVFLWTVLMIFKYLIVHYSTTLAYYVHLLGYIAVTSTIILFIRTVFDFMGKPFSKAVNALAFTYIGIWSLIVLTNDLTNWVVLSNARDIESIYDLIDMTIQPLFVIHTFILYALSAGVIVTLYINLIKRKRANLYRVPRFFFAASVLLTIVINGIHNFFYTFFLDPSFVATVVLSYILYTLIYKRDMGFILISESRKTLISNMREMFFVADDTDRMVDCSEALKKKFQISNHATVGEALSKIKEKAIVYNDIDALNDKTSDLPYLYTIHKTFTPENFDIKGNLYLFYDETNFVKLVGKLEYLRSYDEMTGVYNRNHFERSKAQLFKTYKHFGVISTDVNGLKLFNDYFGHKAGDDLIIRFSNILKKATQDYEDISIVRMGGDEFSVFVGNANKEKINAIKQAILKATQHKDPLKRISIAIGTAIRADHEKIDTAFLKADNELYEMKTESAKEHKDQFIKAYHEQYNK